MKSWCNRGVALKALGRLDEAVASYDKALALDPHDVKTWFNKANAFAAQERYQDALVCFQQAQELDTRNGQFRRAMPETFENRRRSSWSVGSKRGWRTGVFFKRRRLGEYGQARRSGFMLETGLGLDPKNAAAWFNMGHSIGFLGRHQDVVKCCDRALKINPHFPPLWILKGLGLLSMERFRDAMDCFQQAEKLGDASAAGHMARCRTAHAEWYFRLGSQYQQEGNNTEAINCTRRVSPKPGRQCNHLEQQRRGFVCVETWAGGCRLFDRAIALDPRNASAWNNKGCALLAIGKQSEAMACLQEAKRLRT